jgi:hypothetical protein
MQLEKRNGNVNIVNAAVNCLLLVWLLVGYAEKSSSRLRQLSRTTVKSAARD